MTNFFAFVQQNYGVLVLAGITFVVVQILSYLYRWQAARLSAVADGRQEKASNARGADQNVPTAVSRQDSDEMARMQEDIRQLRKGLRVVEARLTGQFVHAKALSGSALSGAHAGSLRHQRTRTAG